MPSLQDHLRALRSARGLSLHDVARQSGLSVQTLSAAERGRVSLSETQVQALAALYGEPVHHFEPTRLPCGLAALLRDEQYREHLTPWIGALLRAECRAGRPVTPQEWLELWTHMRNARG